MLTLLDSGIPMLKNKTLRESSPDLDMYFYWEIVPCFGPPSYKLKLPAVPWKLNSLPSALP